MAKITHIFKTFYPDEPDGGIQEVISSTWSDVDEAWI